MIVTSQSTADVTGYIEYRYEYESMFFPDAADEGAQFESDTFSSLEELLVKVSSQTLEEIRKSFDAKRVWISCISFSSRDEKQGNTATLTMNEKGKTVGQFSTTIHNEDITDQMVEKMEKIHEISENALNQYPIRY